MWKTYNLPPSKIFEFLFLKNSVIKWHGQITPKPFYSVLERNERAQELFRTFSFILFKTFYGYKMTWPNYPNPFITLKVISVIWPLLDHQK
jgi:hypothetical protein